MRFLPWLISLAALAVSHTGAYYVGATRTETRMQSNAWVAEDATRAAADSLRHAVRSTRARVDTVTRTITRRIVTVDTAWRAVPESVFVQVPQVTDARTACVALSRDCAEAQRLFAIERTVHTALSDSLQRQIGRIEVRARDADARARHAQDQTWRRRIEGALGVVVIGVAVDTWRKH